MTAKPAHPPGRSSWRIITEQVVLLTVIGAIGLVAARRPIERADAPPARSPVVAAEPQAAEARAEPAPAPRPVASPPPAPEPPPTPEPDHAAIAAAQAALEEARRDRALAEGRVAAEEEALRQAELEAAQAALASRTLAGRIRDPRARIATVRTRVAALTAETRRLKAEVTSLANAPRPRRKVLSDRTPVARPVEGQEYHFEVRGDRVAFIDLERLVDKLEADARLQIRLATGPARTIASTVGPIGDFSLRYVLGSATPDTIDGLLGRSVSYDLIGWEVVPQRPNRGETLAAIQHPASEFSQVLNTLSPGRATITLWVYPDGFGLYRQLRELLHGRGFEVAARPLPEGIPIRGSPNGSLSAGQ